MTGQENRQHVSNNAESELVKNNLQTEGVKLSNSEVMTG